MSRRDRRVFRARATAFLRRSAPDVVEAAVCWLGTLPPVANLSDAQRRRLVVELCASDRAERILSKGPTNFSRAHCGTVLVGVRNVLGVGFRAKASHARSRRRRSSPLLASAALFLKRIPSSLSQLRRKLWMLPAAAFILSADLVNF